MSDHEIKEKILILAEKFLLEKPTSSIGSIKKTKYLKCKKEEYIKNNKIAELLSEFD